MVGVWNKNSQASVLLGILATLACQCLAQAYQTVLYGTAKDMKISSENYPSRYPPDANVTWSWDVPEGQWAVVFLDFDLDAGVDGYGVGDWLEISEKGSTGIKYTARNPPVVHFQSHGPQMCIRFVSDAQAGEKAFRGFHLQILHGRTDSELEHKIIESTNERDRQKNQEDNNDRPKKVQVTTAVTLIVAFAIIFILVVLYSRRNTRLMRRLSTLSRADRGEAAAAAAAAAPTSPTSPPASPTSPPASPTYPTGAASPTAGSRRPSQPLQRSNSQLDWTARAELSCSSLQSRDRSAQPNDYTRAQPSHQTNIKYTINHETGAAGISVSSTITSSTSSASSRDEPGMGRQDGRDRLAATAEPPTSSSSKSSNNHPTNTTSDFTPPRRLRKSHSEKVMAVSGASSACEDRLHGRNSSSLSKLSTIMDDAEEFDGAGDYVDTIDRLDPIPMEAIRGKNRLPLNLRVGEPEFDLESTSPPPPSYFSQVSSGSIGCYENISPSEPQTSCKRKSSVYANTFSQDDPDRSADTTSRKQSKEERDTSMDEASSISNLSDISKGGLRKPSGLSLASDALGDYTYLASPTDGVYSNVMIKQGDNEGECTNVHVLSQVLPAANASDTAARCLNSPYDIPPTSFDLYNIPSNAEGLYNVPPTHHPNYVPADTASFPPKSSLRDSPYDIPPPHAMG